MLAKIGSIIEKRPKLVIGIILLITIGFGFLLPSLEMQTSMDNFLPDDEIIVAQNRIYELFGGNIEIMMLHIEKDKSASIVRPDALRDQYLLIRQLKEYDEIVDIIGIAGFVDIVCNMEFGKSLDNCSYDEIKTAFSDLMTEPEKSTLKVMNQDDGNENIDFVKYPILSRGKNIDSIDIRNLYIQEREDQIQFSIEVYDLSHFENSIIPPDLKLNVMEWYVEFENFIKPDERLDIDYKIAAHIEPLNPFWEIGNRPLNNIRNLVFNILNNGLFRSYKKEVYLWIKPSDADQYFSSKLESGIVNFNTSSNRVEIFVNKTELGKYGIAPEAFGFSIPAKLGNFKGGFRYFRTPILGRPWRGVTINLDFFQRIIDIIQKRPILGGISEQILDRFGGFTWQDLDDIFNMMNQGDFSNNSLSLKEIESMWEVSDVAADNIGSDFSFFIKPFSLEQMRKSIFTFLSGDQKDFESAEKTMLLVQINGSIGTNELTKITNEIVQDIKDFDKDKDTISVRVTGYSVIESEINEVTMESNSIVIPLIFVMISLILLVSFRRPSYIFIPLLGLSIAIVWLFGTMVILGMEFMIMEVALIPMIMGLGVDYSVHTFHNYRKELATGKSPGSAIVSSIKDIGLAMFLATITTFIAFLSFLSVSMIPLRDFGVLCAIGIAYVFLITITFQAALRYLLDRRKAPKIKKKSKGNKNGIIMERTAKVVLRHPVIILGVTLGITAFMLIGLFSIQTGFKMDQFLPEQNPSVIVMSDITEDFPFASQDQEYIFIEGDVASVEVLGGISKTIENLRDNEFVLMTPEREPKTNSILSVIDNAVSRNSSLLVRFNFGNEGYPRTDSDIKALFDYLYESDLFEMEVKEVLHRKDSDYDATLISVYMDFIGSDEDVNNAMEELYTNLNDDISGGFGKASAIVTGENSMMFVIMNSMTESQLISTGICIILAAIVLIIAYRKPLLGIITLIPVLFSTIWIIGSIYFLGYSLNIMTIMITSLTIGLGITYAIHAVERFRLIADRTGDVAEAVSETIGHTGGALLIAAITTIAGFCMLILTPVPVEQQFGIITALTIFYAFLTSIFILPPVLMFWGKWKKKTKGYIISPGKPKN